MKSIAFFDFDGTLIKKDSFLSFIIFSKGYLNFFLAGVWFTPQVIIAGIFGFDKGKVKERWFSYHFKGVNKEAVNKLGDSFSKHLQDSGAVRMELLSIVKDLQNKGIECIIVSASLDIWIKPFSKSYEMAYICTQAEYINNRLSGKFLGKNCNGEQIKIRINENYKLEEYDRIIVYGDSSGDKEMMSLANEKYWIK